MGRKYITAVVFMLLLCRMANAALSVRGVVYDVGLNYGGKTLSVKNFDARRVDYDMSIIKNVLRCNTVRIEGESTERLEQAAEIAAAHGLKVLFNPWMHEADSATCIRYMEKAAVVAQKLLDNGVDIVFVAGCEYSLFNYGAFPGKTFDERMNWLFSLGGESETEARNKLKAADIKLNEILAKICRQVRKHFSGKVTYSSGTWENVDWDMFDIVGVDYYRRAESDEEYVSGIDRYRGSKPVIVMEMGCCAYEGAASRGGEGFAIFKGVDGDGKAVYENGIVPRRDEGEQASYIEHNIGLLRNAGADGVCVYVFSYPIYPYEEDGIDYDMVSYALVKSFTEDSDHWKQIPAWEPKEAFYQLGELYYRLEKEKQ